ncbi:MAG TPA: hypothetical protein VFZ21_01840, partial [Gemmatimonadaceae bacterium]|nr:hypothetical protein [Gemmatimonadaceae bacterium]
HRAAADSLLARAAAVLRTQRRVRENYHMIDDEIQFPVLVARWLGDPRVPDDRKRAFLLEREPGAPATRLALLAKALALVAGQAMPYARDPSATNLRGFARLDSARWRSSSWRDSDAGYANGRFAMDVNVVWMPLALRSMGDILSALDRLGLVRAGAGDVVTLAGTAAAPDSTLPGTLLSRFIRFPDSLRRAHRTWAGSVRHFVVALGPEQVRSRVRGRLATLPAAERHYWERVVATTRADRDSLVFLALSLDASGRPIGVASTDVGMRMLLATAPMPPDSAARADVLRDFDVLMRPFPVGLFVDTLGPVVANDAYAPAAVWSRFERDRYHSPRVVWGREVNVIEMALAAAIEQALDASGVLRAGVPASYVATLRSALERTRRAVRASGFAEAELWSYRIEGRRLRPTRFGSASDVQLWNTTSLAVEYLLDQIRR